MSAVIEAVPLGALQLVFWGAVLVAAAACTVFAVRHHAGKSDGDPSDPLFWDVFWGSAVILPALLIPAVASPPAGLALAAAACVSGVAAYRTSPRVLGWYSSRRRQREELPALQAAANVHNAVLQRWQRYELDPALAIDFPAMSDVRRPETAAFVKAMREAELLKTLAAPGYLQAVDRLDAALRCAEAAAGAACGEGPSPEAPRSRSASGKA
ncbi:hypothetical protein [Arthrobacter sp. NPDC093139]|uniref:hypothetical protein n=1 Tax=Arthrobacter sp. NPDC093139 TaxID=3363945 RepID=UPI00380B53CA